MRSEGVEPIYWAGTESDLMDIYNFPGVGAGVYADEDNEEDISRNTEMFEAASILSAMQVLFFFTLFPCLYMSQTLCPFLCILYVCLSGKFWCDRCLLITKMLESPPVTIGT